MATKPKTAAPATILEAFKDGGSSHPFQLRERSLTLNQVFMPSPVLIACRTGLAVNAGAFRCYDVSDLWATFDGKGDFLDATSFRDTLLELFHRQCYFLCQLEDDHWAAASDWDVASNWDSFVRKWATRKPDGSWVLTRSRLQELQDAVSNMKASWLECSVSGCAVSVHYACEDESFVCAVGWPDCPLCFNENSAMPDNVLRCQPPRVPSFVLIALIAKFNETVKRCRAAKESRCEPPLTENRPPSDDTHPLSETKSSQGDLLATVRIEMNSWRELFGAKISATETKQREVLASLRRVEQAQDSLKIRVDDLEARMNARGVFADFMPSQSTQSHSSHLDSASESTRRTPLPSIRRLRWHNSVSGSEDNSGSLTRQGEVTGVRYFRPY